MASGVHPHPPKGTARSGHKMREAGELNASIRNLRNKYPAANEVEGGMPVNFTGHGVDPNAERYALKQELMRSGVLAPATDGTNQILNWNVDDRDINMFQRYKKAADMRDYYNFLGKHVDIRQPGMLAWMMKIHPDYVNSQIEWMDQQAALKRELDMIANMGVQSGEQMMLKYLFDNNRLDYTAYAADTDYTGGFFAPARPEKISMSNWSDMFTPAGRTSSQGYAATNFGTHVGKLRNGIIPESNTNVSHAGLVAGTTANRGHAGWTAA